MRKLVLNVPLGFPDTALCGALNALGYSAAASSVSLYQIDIDVRAEPSTVTHMSPRQTSHQQVAARAAELTEIAGKLGALNDLLSDVASDLTEAAR